MKENLPVGNATKLLNRKEASELLGIAEQTLASWACNQRYNLPFIKVGRLVKYRMEHIDAFLNSRIVGQPTY